MSSADTGGPRTIASQTQGWCTADMQCLLEEERSRYNGCQL